MAVRSKVQVWIYRREPQAPHLLFLILKTHAHRGGFWQPVTGGVDPDETLPKAALREAREETGLSFTAEPLPIPFCFEFVSRGEKCIEHGFSLQVAENSPVQLDAREHLEFRWVAAEAALQLIQHPSNQEMLKIFLRSLG